MKLETIAKKGDSLETLKALRDKISNTLDNTKSGRDIASLSRQLQLVLSQIDELEAEKKDREGDTVLDLILAKHNKVRPSRDPKMTSEIDALVGERSIS